jgi:hypothetical protein
MADSRDLPNAVNQILGSTGTVNGGREPHHGPSRGSQRARRSIALSIGASLVLFFAARLLLELETLPTAVRVLIALAPIPAFAWFLWAFVQAAAEADELERRIQLEALAVAFPLTLLLLMTMGLLQIAIPLSPDDWSYRHIWPIVYMFYLLGLAWARRRYA